MRRSAAVLVLLACAAGRAPVWGQAEPQAPPAPPVRPPLPTLTVTLASAVPRVQAKNLLDDGTFVSLMRQGFPLRLHYRLELWRRRTSWFDQFVSGAAWDAVVQQDALTGDYLLARTGGSTSRHRTIEDLARALSIPYQVTLAPREGSTGEFYFVAILDAETLNDSDIDEVMRWLKGDVSPAVSGQGNIGEALSRGAQRLLVRLAGLPRVRLETKSEVFERR